MNEEQIQAMLAQQQEQLAQASALAQQYGLSPQEASQQMQVFRQLANSGRFAGTMEDYFAQRAQGQVQTPGNSFPAPTQPPPGLLDPPTPGTGGTTPPPPIRGDGSDRTPRPPYQPPDGGRPTIPTLPVLPPPPRGDQGPGGPGRGPDYGGAPQQPGVTVPANISDTLASFGYMRGPNGEILPQMLQGGWSPYQAPQQQRQTPGFAPNAGQGMQLPQLGYDPAQEGYSWFTPPPQAAGPGAGAGPTPPPAGPTPGPPQTGTNPGRGGPGGPGGGIPYQLGGPITNPNPMDPFNQPKMGLLGMPMTLPASLRGLLG